MIGIASSCYSVDSAYAAFYCAKDCSTFSLSVITMSLGLLLYPWELFQLGKKMFLPYNTMNNIVNTIQFARVVQGIRQFTWKYKMYIC